jgi:hypothetical protein
MFNAKLIASGVVTLALLVGALTRVTQQMITNAPVDVTGTAAVPLKSIDGLVTAPGLTWTSDPGSGWYRIGANDYGYAVNQIKKLELTSALFTVTPPLTVNDVFTANVSGSGSTFVGSFFEASLANGNNATVAIGKSTSGNSGVGLSFTPNATAANSTGCLQVMGQSATLCVDGNNKVSVGAGGLVAAANNHPTCTISGGTCSATVPSGTACICAGTVAAATVACAVTGTTALCSSGAANGTVMQILAF